jgi:pimeloyl-ACP methyl ester carboxylesterase
MTQCDEREKNEEILPLIDHGSLQIDVTEDGAGPPLVLLHSSVSGNRQWKKLIDQLRGRYRVIAPNLYGYGKTTPWTDSKGPLSLRDAAFPALAVAQQIGGPFNLVGHSWGGVIALHAAAILRKRVSSLVLFEPMIPAALREHGRHAAWVEVEALYKDVKRLGSAGRWDALAKRFTIYFNGDGAWETTPAERRAAVAALLRPNFFEWDVTGEAITLRDFESITARTLVMRSADTRPALREMVQLIRDFFPHWSFAEVEAGGHMAPLARPDLVNPVIADFLDSN